MRPIFLAVATILSACASMDDHRFHGATLSEVVEYVQPYTPRLIELDRSVAGIRFTGSLDRLTREQAEQWVRNLPIVFPVEVQETPYSMHVQMR